MADTYTPQSGLIIQTPGENDDTWGTKLNDNFQMLEDMIGARASITVTSGDYTLSDNDGAVDEAKHASLLVTGTLSGNVNVIYPDSGLQRLIVVTNTTSGSFTVTVKTAGGSGIEIPQDSVPYIVYYRTNAQGIQLPRIVNVARLNASQLWTSAQAAQWVSLTDGANIAVDASLGNNFEVTLGGNRTLANPTNPLDGQIINVLVRQDSFGNRTLAYGSQYRWPDGIPPVITPNAGRASLLTFQRRTSGTANAPANIWLGSYILNYIVV